jgi:hypothetical protein
MADAADLALDALAAGVITLLASIRENLLAMQRRHLLVAAESKVLRGPAGAGALTLESLPS